jgi:hypothetical protein
MFKLFASQTICAVQQDNRVMMFWKLHNVMSFDCTYNASHNANFVYGSIKYTENKFKPK